MRWRRVLAWTLAIYAAQVIAGLGYSLLDTWRLFHAANVETFMTMDRMALHAVCFVVDLILFRWFASGTRDRRLLHVIATVALIQLIQFAVGHFLVGKSIHESIQPAITGRLVLAAAIGLGLASLRRTQSP